jgi:transcriptional regulator with XRE-family HTH domain
MTPDEFKRARRDLGLTFEQMAMMLGYEGEQAKSQVHHMENGRRGIRPAQRRLVAAYLAGYRPGDWPELLAVCTPKALRPASAPECMEKMRDRLPAKR